MKIKMELLSDMIFGDGMSVPGAEDISVLHDENGFPYYKGGTFKGVFREELRRYLEWTGTEHIQQEIKETKKLSGEDEKELSADQLAAAQQAFLFRLMGKGDSELTADQLIFTDFQISEYIQQEILQELGNQNETILELFTHLRTFTALEDDHVKKGSLRMARCVNKGISLYGEIDCPNSEDEKIVEEVIGMIKWIGSMRNRGFGKVKLSVAKPSEEESA